MSTRQGFHGPETFQGRSQMDENEKMGWYTENLASVTDTGRRLLEEYAGIPSDMVLSHVSNIRDRAFRIWPYACIGQVRFLNYSIPTHPYYGAALARLRSGATFLDAGCCFGQEIRYLIHVEKIAGRQLYGFDLESAFIEIGHDLFRDGETLDAKIVCGDVLADPGVAASQQLTSLESKMDIIHCASFLHVWDWAQQIRAVKRLVSFSNPSPGSLIIGNQIGSAKAGEYPMPTGNGFNYRHDVESMHEFWRQVGEETGTEWEVDSDLFMSAAVRENAKQSWADPDMRMIWFLAKRV